MDNQRIKKTIGSLLAVLAGGVFIFSAITKLMPIEAFEISLVDIGFGSFSSAPVLARLIIGLEFVIGAMLIFHFKLRKVTIPVATLLLLFFTVYIGYLLKTYGNRGNCGCFGTVVEFTPLEGIVKNVVLLIMLAVAYQWSYKLEFGRKTIVAIVLSVILLALPFLVNPMGIPPGFKPLTEFKSFPLDTTFLYNGAIGKIDENANVSKGKHIVAFLSANCEHCRLAAKKLVVFKKQTPSLPLVFVLYNNTEKLPEFFNDTKSEDVPRILLKEKSTFLDLTNGVFPRIYYVEDGRIVYETNLYLLDSKGISDWLAKK